MGLQRCRPLSRMFRLNRQLFPSLVVPLYFYCRLCIRPPKHWRSTRSEARLCRGVSRIGGRNNWHPEQSKHHSPKRLEKKQKSRIAGFQSRDAFNAWWSTSIEIQLSDRFHSVSQLFTYSYPIDFILYRSCSPTVIRSISFCIAAVHLVFL